MGGVAGGGEISFEFVAASTGAPINVSTFSQSISIGAASVDRFIVVVCGAFGPSGRPLTKVTISGITMDLVTTVEGGTSDNPAKAGMAILAYPSGTTATIELTFSGNISYPRFAVYRLISSSGDVADYHSDSATTTGDTVILDSSLSTEPGDACIACTYQRNGAAASSTPMTEDYEQDVGSGEFFSCYSKMASGSSQVTTVVTSDTGIQAGEFVGVAAAFRPA